MLYKIKMKQSKILSKHKDQLIITQRIWLYLT